MDVLVRADAIARGIMGGWLLAESDSWWW